MHTPTAAVLTGDLIRSTRAVPGALERAMAVLAEAAGEVAGWPNGADTRFTRFRGDGWQFCVAGPGKGLRAALTAIARLRGADVGLATRAAIGVGRIDSLGTDNLADAGGPAFEASGHALDDMPRGRRITIAGAGVAALHHAVVDLLDERAARWTPQQAEAAALYLGPDNPTLADIAPRLGISAQAVNYRLAGAGAPAIRRALAQWEESWPAPEAADA
ncbi:MAG: hypothetical protein U1E40_09445 [Amaricoccus sp.]